MKKNELIELTKKLYSLTLLFPKKEPLRYKIREVADEILAGFIKEGNSASNNEKNFFYLKKENKNGETLLAFLEVAKAQNWVSPKEIEDIFQSYAKFFEEAKNHPKEISQVEVLPFSKKENGETISPSLNSQTSLNQRQEKILEVLKEKGHAQVWEIQKIFPDVSKRTLRRDFRSLLKKGIIERKGERNTTFYQIKI